MRADQEVLGSLPDGADDDRAYDADSGTFDLVAHDIASPSGVESVRFPVWYKNNQENTIYWYDAEKQADGTFKAIVNVRNHNYIV